MESETEHRYMMSKIPTFYYQVIGIMVMMIIIVSQKSFLTP